MRRSILVRDLWWRWDDKVRGLHQHASKQVKIGVVYPAFVTLVCAVLGTNNLARRISLGTNKFYRTRLEIGIHISE
jgi:hypothetical protein